MKSLSLCALLLAAFVPEGLAPYCCSSCEMPRAAAVICVMIALRAAGENRHRDAQGPEVAFPTAEACSGARMPTSPVMRNGWLPSMMSG